MTFSNRIEAGQLLGQKLENLRGGQVQVLAIPRGGVPVAAGVADALDAPLEVLVVRKLGSPRNPEFGYGAVAEGGGSFLDPETVDLCGVTPQEVEDALSAERFEAGRRALRFRGDRGLVDLSGKVAVVVDDGIATGATARAALRSVRALNPDALIFAAPVGGIAQVQALRAEATAVVVVDAPGFLGSVGCFYDDFAPTTDEEVMETLQRFQSMREPSSRGHFAAWMSAPHA